MGRYVGRGPNLEELEHKREEISDHFYEMYFDALKEQPERLEQILRDQEQELMFLHHKYEQRSAAARKRFGESMAKYELPIAEHHYLLDLFVSHHVQDIATAAWLLADSEYHIIAMHDIIKFLERAD